MTNGPDAPRPAIRVHQNRTGAKLRARLRRTGRSVARGFSAARWPRRATIWRATEEWHSCALARHLLGPSLTQRLYPYLSRIEISDTGPTFSNMSSAGGLVLHGLGVTTVAANRCSLRAPWPQGHPRTDLACTARSTCSGEGPDPVGGCQRAAQPDQGQQTRSNADREESGPRDRRLGHACIVG